MARGTLVIDIQLDYFPGGAYPLSGPGPAAEVARSVVDDARAAGDWVGFVQHLAEPGEGSFLVAGTTGADLLPTLTPASDDEPIIQKTRPNSFIATGLEGILAERDIDELTVVGMMSSMCVDATVRAALDLGLAVTVVEDGCAAPDLEFGGVEVPGEVVHAAFMAALRDAGASVVSRGRG
ncbi:cysteine hydrolase [Plantibacter flavus]|uniref:cysteine hydrolase family protein n=1 Tax=Plantibacter flavus TaxID=150123 RepID=UPI003F17650D